MAVKVPVVLGGTGADNAADARANLGISGNTAGGVYSGISISNAQITSSNVSGNVTVLTGNVMLTKSGSNVTFETPGSTVVGAQFKTPGIHDLATQRVVTLKSNNYSGNRSGDYLVPTINIKAKYNNVSINTAGRILYANRFDDEAQMPDVAKYEGFVSYERNPGSTGQLYFANTQSRQRLYNANLDLIPAQNAFFNVGTAAVNFKEMHLGANARILGNVEINKGLAVGTDDFVIKYQNPTQQMKIGINTDDPQHEVDIRANVYISGNLTVKGNVYVVDTQHLIVQDSVIELGANTVGTPTIDTGVLMNRGSLANAFLGFDESRDEMVVAYTSNPSSVTTINIDGYTTFRANSTVLAVEGDTKKTNFSKVSIGTASPKPYKVDIRGNTFISDNLAIGNSMAVGYTDGRIPQANLDVNGNAYISGALAFGSLSSAIGVSDGGTGATSFTDGGVLLGSGTSALTATPVLTDGVMLVGDGTTDPALEGNTTLRTSIGVGTGNTPQFYGANVTGNASINRSLAVGYTDGRVPQANLDVSGNVYVSGPTILTMANTTGNVNIFRNIAIGHINLVPGANLDVRGNSNVGILNATSLRVNGTAISTTSTFLGLSDTPSTYSSQSGKLTAVNSAENALEFVDDNAIVMAIALG